MVEEKETKALLFNLFSATIYQMMLIKVILMLRVRQSLKLGCLSNTPKPE